MDCFVVFFVCCEQVVCFFVGFAMNPNNHGQGRRNSSNFNRHNNGGRPNHMQRWPGRYAKEYDRDYRGCVCYLPIE